MEFRSFTIPFILLLLRTISTLSTPKHLSKFAIRTLPPPAEIESEFLQHEEVNTPREKNMKTSTRVMEELSTLLPNEFNEDLYNSELHERCRLEMDWIQIDEHKNSNEVRDLNLNSIDNLTLNHVTEYLNVVVVTRLTDEEKQTITKKLDKKERNFIKVSLIVLLNRFSRKDDGEENEFEEDEFDLILGKLFTINQSLIK